jgi:outer membrane protein TolC
MESEAELSVQKKALAQAEEALRTAEEQYKKGFIASLDYKDMAFAYTTAQFSHLRTLYQYMLSKVKLERAAGLWD